MLLVIDIGNTHIVLGVFREGTLEHSWRISTRREKTVDEYAVVCSDLFRLRGVSTQGLEAVVICSVVPPLNSVFEELAGRFLGVRVHFVEPEEQGLMPIKYHPVSDVGADRIVNSVAAYELFGGPAIVVDFGTATTFDAVSREGEYLGGIIAPGIGISAEALFARAARLPRVDIRKPDQAIGRSTVSSIQSGIFYGYIGLVGGILERMKRELVGASVTATGGLASLIATEFDGFDRIEENLTLEGLRICFNRLSAF